MYLKQFKRNLKNKLKKETMSYHGNMGTIAEIKVSVYHNPIQHDRTKHVEFNQHFIKQKLKIWTNLHALVPTKE